MITVLGGGPAGATASWLLASWGHSVQLITKAGAYPPLAVSLPPSCAKLFDAAGVGGAIVRVPSVRSTGNTVWWGGAGARLESFADGAQGWQLDVSELSGALLNHAIAAGVRVDYRLVQEPPAGLVLDCTGRSGLVARARNVRQMDDGARTIALVGEWRRGDRWPIPDDSHTLIESYEDGWMWSVPLANGTRHIAAMIDPQRSDLTKGGSSKSVYLSEIRKTRIFRALIDGASLDSGPRGWDASPYHAAAYAGDDWLLVGDAGSFIDPLSSAGVKKALASAWLAAVAAHTIVSDSSMRSHALAFFSSREQEIATQMARASRRLLAEAAAGHPHSFWNERADEPVQDDGERATVVRAFDVLKASDRLSVTLGPDVAIAPRPCVRGHAIVLEPHVVVAADANGTRYVSGLDVVALVDLAPLATTVPGLYEIYVQRCGAAPLDAFLTALATAIARGWLVSKWPPTRATENTN